MKKFLPLLLCLLLSIFTVARATNPTHTSAPNRETAQEKPTGQKTDAKPLLEDASTDEEKPPGDDENTEGTSDDEGENLNDVDGAADVGDTGDDDGGDDDGGDDAGG